MGSKKLTYNIPGCGNLTANIFEYSQHLEGFVENYGHFERFHRINQLGRLRDVFRGAHHNRFEYVFLQLSLISELCNHKKSDIGLSGEGKFCGKIKKLGRYPTKGELLQCLVILTNMGYLEGTFSTSRAWLYWIKENSNVYKNFKKGLNEKDYLLLDKTIDQFDYHQFNILLALFQLQRYKRLDKDIVKFSTELLRKYISDEKTELQVRELKKLYDSIRQLAYITLDSFYAPVPFSLDLSSILLTFDSLYESLFINNTTYKIALSNLERVLQETVYMSSDSCLNTAKATTEKLQELEFQTENITGISQIYDLVCPSCNIENLSIETKDLDWQREKKIILEYRITPKDRDEIPDFIFNEVKWELKVRNRIGVSRARASLLKNSKKNIIKVTFGLTHKDEVQCLKSALKISKELFDFQKAMPANHFNTHRFENSELLMEFLLKSIFGWNKRFILENKVRSKNAVFISNGRHELIRSIDDYLSVADKYLNTNEIFEVKQTKKLVEDLGYSGLTIAFVGGAKLFTQGANEESCEFDGLVIFPTIHPEKYFAHIVEAKNKSKGFTDAKKQLECRVSAQLLESISMKIEKLNNRTAYAALNLKKTPN